jgi:hypothetical protein
LRYLSLIPAAALGLALAGCAQLAATKGDVVEVEVFYVDEIAPGARHWFAWPVAREHCAARGLSPKLVNQSGAIVSYRCVSPE